MKKIINNPQEVVKDMISGIVIANPELKSNNKYMYISRKNPTKKVALITGGGSGHEPAHAGYVGYGMLDVAVCGNIFTAPSQESILNAIKEYDQGKGVLLIIKNYSGDVMNFEMAMEFAKMEGIDVKSVTVRDDVSVEESTYSTGRRGIAGTIFIHKIAGAMAETGATLEEVYNAAEKTIKNVRSIGMSMSSCILPNTGKPSFTLAEDEMVIGMGIHGEPGIAKEKISTANEIAKKLVNKILLDYDFKNSETAVMINGLGGTPLMELNILVSEVSKILKEQNISVYKYYVGNFMTSLEMKGCTLSILKVDEQLKELLDYPCYTSALKQN